MIVVALSPYLSTYALVYFGHIFSQSQVTDVSTTSKGSECERSARVCPKSQDESRTVSVVYLTFILSTHANRKVSDREVKSLACRSDGAHPCLPGHGP